MDPKLAASIERILTVGLTYLVTKYGSRIAGLDSIVPDLVVIIIFGGSALNGLLNNTKARLLARTATVVPDAKIKLNPLNPESKELAKSSPDNVTVDAH